MSTTSFTRIENTVVSGSSLLAGLSNDDWTQILFDRNLDQEISIPGTVAGGSTAASGYYMTINDVTKAVAGVLMVNGRNAYVGSVAGCGVINFGSDLSTVAKNYQTYLNLTSAGQSRTMTFQLQGVATLTSSYATALTPGTIVISSGTAGTGGTSTKLLINGAGAVQALFSNVSNGTISTVTVTAINISAGSEVVSFAVDSL
jgi:hypothetical protein